MSGAGASTRDLIGWRMRALGLWHSIPGSRAADGGGPQRVRAVLDRLLAIQGQDWNAARWALGLRAPGIVDAEVRAAFDQGLVVRSWPMRGTIHVLAAEDLGWIQAATNHRVLPGAVKRRAFIGLDDASLARMTDIAVERLSGGVSLSRDELAAAWTEAGIGDPERGLGPWRYHVIWWLSQNGIIVSGPAAEGEPRFVLAEEWITAPRRLEGEEALAELARRFALGRGPVLDRDLAWWTGLTVREARIGLSAAADAGAIERVEIDGGAYWADPELLAGPSGAPEPGEGAVGDPLLLPAFDEHLLGYTERGAVLDPDHFGRIVPGRNGMFRATVVDGGRAVGVWTRAPRAAGTRIDVEAFPGERIDLARLGEAAAGWSVFHGVPADLAEAAADAGSA